MPKRKHWITLKQTYIFESRYFKVRQDEVMTPDGKSGLYGIVEGGDWVMVIPKVSDTFFLVDQFRYPTQKRSLEFPAGKVEDGELVEQAVIRELREETGLTSKNITKLGYLYQANGHETIAFYVYLAEHCVEGERHLDSTEGDMVTKKIMLDKLKSLVKLGKITDAPTVASLAFYLVYQQ